MKVWLKVLGVLAASLVLLELALQAAAFVAWRSLRREPVKSSTSSSADRPLRILCVGDSFTFGQGASDPEHSYPSVLQACLEHRHGLDAQVENHAWPGQDSRDVYRTLAHRLGIERYDVVCILVGVNDRWNRPVRVEATEVELGAMDFKWRWRTARLWRWVTRDRDPGGWHPRADERWSGPTAAMIAVAERLVADAGLELGSERPGHWPYPEAVRAALAAADERLRQGDPPAAARGLQDSIAAQEDLRLRRKLVEVLARMDRRQEVEDALAPIRAAYERTRGERDGIELLAALSAAGRSQEALDFGRLLVEAHPSSRDAWRLLSQAAMNCDAQSDLAMQAARRCLETGGPLHRDSAPDVAVLGRLLAPGDAQSAAALLNAALLLQGGCAEYAYVSYLVCSPWIPAATMAHFVEIEGLDQQGAAVLGEAFAAAYGEGAKTWLVVLRHNLRAMQLLAAACGARVFFVSYPFRAEDEEIAAAVALETGSTFVNVRERFERELAGRAWEELFVVDNHCNDTGYAILAEEVGAAIARWRAQREPAGSSAAGW